MTTQRKSESDSSVRDISAPRLTGRVAPPPFIRVPIRKEPVEPGPPAKDPGKATAQVPGNPAPPSDPIAFVMADAPEDPRRPVRHGVLEHVFFDGHLELRLWWEAESPLSKSAIEL